MGYKGKISLGVISVVTIGLLTALLFNTLRSPHLPNALLASGAVGLHVEAPNWNTLHARYETPLLYRQISSQILQQMPTEGWRLLGTSLTAGPSILNPNPPSILFERTYLYGTLYEIARVSCVNGSPTRVHVVVLRTIRWPQWRRWLQLT